MDAFEKIIMGSSFVGGIAVLFAMFGALTV